MITYAQIPLFVTAVLALIFLVVILLLMLKQQRAKKLYANFFEQLDNVTNPEEFRKNNISLVQKYIDYWDSLLRFSHVVPASSIPTRNAMNVTLALVTAFLAMMFLTMSPLAGFMLSGITAGLIIMFCKNKIQKNEARLVEQIPGLLATLKSGVQSGQGPELALKAAINNTAEPLYSELSIMIPFLDTGTISSALAALRRSTNNRNIRFLCSCIELSSEVGANLEEQIVIIEEILKEQKRLRTKLRKAISDNKPLTYVSLILPPFLFLFTYSTSELARDFWFVEPLSYVVLLAVGVISFIGTAITKKLISNVTNIQQ